MYINYSIRAVFLAEILNTLLVTECADSVDEKSKVQTHEGTFQDPPPGCGYAGTTAWSPKAAALPQVPEGCVTR